MGRLSVFWWLSASIKSVRSSVPSFLSTASRLMVEEIRKDLDNNLEDPETALVKNSAAEMLTSPSLLMQFSMAADIS